MLNRFRDFVKRLELPQEELEQEEVVYRIIDADLNTQEVTPAQYAIWRTQNDVTRRAVVGQDTVENVMVRTTFSIMPENRTYKPYGTSAYALPLFDPLLEYFQRYDTREQAEAGHRNALDRIRSKAAEAQAEEEISRAFSGTAAEVRETISAQLPNLFSVRRTDQEAVIRTPLLRPDGSFVEVAVASMESGFELTEFGSPTPRPGTATENTLLQALGVSVIDGALACSVDDSSELTQGIVRLAQAVAWATFDIHSSDTRSS